MLIYVIDNAVFWGLLVFAAAIIAWALASDLQDIARGGWWDVSLVQTVVLVLAAAAACLWAVGVLGVAEWAVALWGRA